MPQQKLLQPPMLLLAVGGFLAVATEVLPIGLLPLMAEDLGVTESLIGLLVSAYAAVVVFASIPLNAWTSALPRKPLLVGLLAGYGLSNVILCLAQDYSVALTGRVIAGACHALFFAVVFGYATRLAPPGRMGAAVALVNAGNAVAIAVGVPLSTWLGATVGWRWSFGCAAIIALLLAVGAAVVMPAIRGSAVSGGTQLKEALAEPALRRVIVAVVVMMTGQFALYTFITPVLVQPGFTATNVGFALLAYGGAGVLGLLLCSRLTDTALRPALLLSLLVMTGCFLAIALLGGAPAWTLAAVIVWGLLYGPVPSYVTTAALSAFRDHPDTVAAVHNSTFNIGISAGALVGAQMLLVGDPSVIGFAAAALTLLALVVVFTGARQGFPRMSPK
ncbi:putative MFS family arabinose efflux permease [Arthrobacter sp. CAN_A212]|uniref:MFS transporter n=1 Tax=Arthrobacter sp. CAN_A212 TaxID=2787719 RepID=UPI0018C9EEF4